MDSTGFGAVWPQPAQGRVLDDAAELDQLLDVARLALAVANAGDDLEHRLVPTRHGGHLPQDSSWQKSRKNRATSTMQVSSSMTIMPPEPMIAPSWVSVS